MPYNFVAKTGIASFLAFLLIGGVYLFLHKGFFKKLSHTPGTVDTIFLETTQITSSEITLYAEGTFARKDDHYFAHHFYSGTYRKLGEWIQFHYDDNDVPDNELTKAILYPPTLSLFSLSEENAGDTTVRVYTELAGL